MFRVKICGVASAEDAVLAAELGADAVGLNFYRGSPRCVSRDEARRIVRALGNRVVVVAVFVNEAPVVIVPLCRELGIGTVQLAGDEPEEEARLLPLRRIRSIRPAPDGRFAPSSGYPCEAFLLDSRVPGKFGGTGTPLDWVVAAEWAAEVRRGPAGDRPLILAGGLRPDNVAAAIRIVRPDGVDVASGVETGSRAKDRAKLEVFIRNAREGFAGAAA